MFKQRKLWAMVTAVACITITVVLATVPGFNRGPTTEPAASDDTGYRDFSFSATNVSTPTANKSQSKLWFNDGIWWGSLFDRSSTEYRIHSYNWDSRAWSDTGTLIDERHSSKSDILWDGTHLYVVSAGPSPTVDTQSARLLRYSYDAATKKYALDPGFPVTISNGGMESIVLDKDTSGKLWVTYTQNSQVYVNHTLNDDLTWTEPFVLPVQGTTVDPDDISSIVAFDSQIGVMWSNQADKSIYFATHRDGDVANVWQPSTALRTGDASEGLNDIADDHINLKADSSGRVYAAVKTSFDKSVGSNPETPLNILLVRDRDGRWSNHVFGRKSDNHTRSTVLIDEEHRDLYMFATNPCCSGGEIYYKKTSLDDISFPEGKGTPFIQNTTAESIDHPTSTKQTLDGTSGLLVLASDNTSGYYLHNVFDLDETDTSDVQPAK